MPIDTNLDIAPYFDDFDTKKDYYKVLFKPKVAVQTRELNQLQTILQNQIEKFADNVFQDGTIVEGCNISLHSMVPYIKILDLETDGKPVSISQYKNLSIINSANVTAYITEVAAGFETKTPDLNTLFIKYNTSGEDGNTFAFSDSDTLTVFSRDYPIFGVDVINGSTLFSNNDSLVFVSAIAVQNSIGGKDFVANAFNTGDVIQNGVANAIIVEANSTVNSTALVLKIKPLSSDLLTANTLKWRFSQGDTIRNANTANTANLYSTIGSGAGAEFVTDSLGKVLDSISITSSGSGYYVQPHAALKIDSNSNITATEIDQLDLTAKNYLTNITIANSSSEAIGYGYGVTIDEGTIYQKGYFSRVNSQLIIVNKYSNTGFSKSVGFYTKERLVNSDQDPSLLDNASGFPNYTAPGADRLELDPTLYVLSKSDADANTGFLPIIEFADGRPYKQNKSTVYGVLGNEMAKRTFEESGNFVIDQFILSTKDSSTFSENSTIFKINIDPGRAYINGFRVDRPDNYQANVARGVDSVNNPNAILRLGYGNFIYINQLAGTFEFNTASVVKLYDTVKTYISSAPGAAITPTGNQIGTARIRSLVLDNGEPGTSNAVYRMYLFDIVMNTGKNFSLVKSIYHDGTNKGIADVVGTATLQDFKNSSLLFKTVDAMKSANSISYTYRTLNQGEVASSAGIISLNLGVNEEFPYSGLLSDIEKREILVLPKTNYQSQSNASGVATVNTTSTTVTGSGGSNFLSEYHVGDWIKVGNNTSSTICQIAQITAASSMVLTANAGVAFTNGNTVLYFPNNVPISLTNNSNKYANVQANGQMDIFLGNTIANTSGSGSSANVVVAYNATRSSVSSNAKTVVRNSIVRFKLANNVGSISGPWAIGVSDVFRTKGVYTANGASRTETFNANTGVINSGTANAFISSNTYFANGDSVTYFANTTSLTGIANNTLYYVVYANSTGFSLSSTRGGANLTITASGTSELHSFVGSPLYFTPDTNGVSNVINQFYIDNNQKEDYLDTSYLFRKPRLTPLSGNDVILVVYDTFIGGNTGLKTISSYPISDSIPYANLISNTSIHTLEMSEMNGVYGKYYDLRDQFDFRPKSSNTIPLASDYGNTGVINPGEPIDADRFISGTEQYFPAPDSSMFANISYYVGRTDRVVIDENTNYNIRKGIPGVIDSVPPEPGGSMTLQILRIPPYPSLPEILSDDTAKIADTKMANEIYGKRKNLYTITLGLNVNQRTMVQTKNYKMADIANLERRIKDLEYYVSFSFAESLAKSRFIPSSSSSLLDRFRYGFFVDPFGDYGYADIGNPEFYSTIKENQLWPKIIETNIQTTPDDPSGDVITPPYIEFPIAFQNDATDGKLANTVANTGTVSSMVCARYNHRTFSCDDDGLAYDEFVFSIDPNGSSGTIYFSGLNNGSAIQVLQGSGPDNIINVIASSQSATYISQSDINGHPGIFDLNYTNDYGVIGGLNGVSWTSAAYGPLGWGIGNFIYDSFKLRFTPNTTYGNYLKVRVFKAKSRRVTQNIGYLGTYEFIICYPALVPINNPTPVPVTPVNYNYTGFLSINPPTFTLYSTNEYYQVSRHQSTITHRYFAEGQTFTVRATGLRPKTKHKFYLMDIDVTNNCDQITNQPSGSSSLITDENGAISFNYHYQPDTTYGLTTDSYQNKINGSIAGAKTIKLKTIDGSSVATGIIGMNYYSNIPVTGNGQVYQQLPANESYYTNYPINNYGVTYSGYNDLNNDNAMYTSSTIAIDRYNTQTLTF